MKKKNLVSFWAAALEEESTVDHKPGIIYPALFALQIIMLPFQEYKYCIQIYTDIIYKYTQILYTNIIYHALFVL